MYSIKDLEDTLGLSYERIRTRITHLRTSFEGVTETGKRGKILVTEQGLALLKRLRELEKDGYSLETGLEEIEKELENEDKNGDKSTAKLSESTGEIIQILKDEIQFLRAELERKDQQIQQLLPGSTRGKGIIRKVWGRIW